MVEILRLTSVRAHQYHQRFLHTESTIVSVEDVYKCKRSISVPGISVNVRRVKVRCFIAFSLLILTFTVHRQILWKRVKTPCNGIAGRNSKSSIAFDWGWGRSLYIK